jgi:hypothetical protein
MNLSEKGAFTVNVYPIETQHITEYNKELLIQTESLVKKNEDLLQ